ncbi:MAG: hypothetical protein JXA89_28455 [Anaerolineae bacterium]|nr:hypothetical protein [Anaerolineae bacterium]
MSLITNRDYLAQKEYYHDQMRAASKYALVSLALGNRARGNRHTSRALAWLGQRLIAWGSNLQKQYDTVVSSSIPQSTNPVATP